MADLPVPLVADVRTALRDLRVARLAAPTWPAVAGDLARLSAAVERSDEASVQRALLPVTQVAFEGKVRGRLASADRKAALVTATKPTSSLPIVGAVCGALICGIGFLLGGGLVLVGTALFGLFIFGVALAGTRTNAERTEDRIARRESPTRVALEPAPAAVVAAIRTLEQELPRLTGPRRTALALAVWTFFVWLTRVRNAVGDDDLSTTGKVGSLALAGSFLVLGAFVLDSLRNGDRRGARVALLALWTIVVWPVRAVQIATADHGAAFVVVHLALGITSIALAVVAVRANGGFSRAKGNR